MKTFMYICICMLLKYVISVPIEENVSKLKSNGQVTITAGFTTLWEWLKSWFFGYQPELTGTASQPLIQYVFTDVEGMPMVTHREIKPSVSGSGGQQSVVKEPSWYVPDSEEKLRQAAEIMQRIRNSDQQVVFDGNGQRK